MTKETLPQAVPQVGPQPRNYVAYIPVPISDDEDEYEEEEYEDEYEEDDYEEDEDYYYYDDEEEEENRPPPTRKRRPPRQRKPNRRIYKSGVTQEAQIVFHLKIHVAS